MASWKRDSPFVAEERGESPGPVEHRGYLGGSSTIGTGSSGGARHRSDPSRPGSRAPQASKAYRYAMRMSPSRLAVGRQVGVPMQISSVQPQGFLVRPAGLRGLWRGSAVSVGKQRQRTLHTRLATDAFVRSGHIRRPNRGGRSEAGNSEHGGFSYVRPSVGQTAMVSFAARARASCAYAPPVLSGNSPTGSHRAPSKAATRMSDMPRMVSYQGCNRRCSLPNLTWSSCSSTGRRKTM